MKLKVFTAFSGYDSQCMALDKLGIDYELVGWSEIDKYAIQAHNAVYPQWAERNFGDISKIDWANVPDFDLFTYSFPCQDISSAGKQRGLQKGSETRSSLLWECQKAIEAKRPKYCLMENVAALVSEKFRPFFLEWERLMCRYGYANYNKVLNAKDYGIPQNRERIFMVSILDPNKAFYWPEPIILEKRLKDVLESDVDEKYYLSDNVIESLNIRAERNKNKGNGFGWKPTLMAGGEAHYNFEGVSVHPNSHALEFKGQESIKQDAAPSLRATDYKAPNCVWEKVAEPLRIPQATKQGYIEVPTGSLFDMSYPESKTRRGRVQEGGKISPTLMDSGEAPCYYEGTAKTMCLNSKVNGKQPSLEHRIYDSEGIATAMTTGFHPNIQEPTFRIRKLTPRECFCLMGVTETDIDKIQQSGVSQSQQYKMAGNSIVVDVLEHIFRKMFVNTGQESQQLSLF